jgi:hypothetical protein
LGGVWGGAVVVAEGGDGAEGAGCWEGGSS